jgi:UDP-N-acetylglucosamine 2-epimerase (non-hydrolysing)
MSRKVVSVVGARPQFVKLSPIARALDGKFEHIIVHTGQHYDDTMSRVFFEELSLPQPDYNLGVGSGTHAVQTASMMIGLEEILQNVRPDVVAVYGDTNSMFLLHILRRVFEVATATCRKRSIEL